MSTAEITIRMSDGECPATIAKPAGKGPWPGVIFFMDGIGYRPALVQMADRLAGKWLCRFVARHLLSLSPLRTDQLHQTAV